MSLAVTEGLNPDFPIQDIGEGFFPDDFELRMQVDSVFEQVHANGEAVNYFFSIAHRAIHLGATTLDVDSVAAAISEGVATFEIVSATVQPGATYSSVTDMARVIYGAQQFLADLSSPEVFDSKLTYARSRMHDDTPVLTDVVREIVGRRLGHDEVSVNFALGGAAVMRAMQIYIDRLEPAEDAVDLEEE